VTSRVTWKSLAGQGAPVFDKVGATNLNVLVFCGQLWIVSVTVPPVCYAILCVLTGCHPRPEAHFVFHGWKHVNARFSSPVCTACFGHLLSGVDFALQLRIRPLIFVCLLNFCCSRWLLCHSLRFSNLHKGFLLKTIWIHCCGEGF
jgi:hypothetical protein